MARTPNKVTRTPAGRYTVKFRHDGKGTSRTFDTYDDGDAFARDGAVYGWDRAMGLADSRAQAAGRHLDGQPTVGQLAREIADGQPRPNTRENYQGRAGWIERHPLGDMPVGAVAPGHVQEFLAWLGRQEKRTGSGTLSSRTILQVHVYLVQVFRRARAKGWTATTPMDHVEPPKVVDAKPVPALSEYEVRAIFAQAPDPNAAAYFRFLLATGARPGEAKSCTWDGVIPWSDGGNVDVHIPGTKSKNADRWVTIPRTMLPPVAVDAWSPYLFNPRARYDEIFRGMVDRAQMVGPARDAGFEPLTYASKAEALADRSAVIRPTPHSLRHTHATRLFHSGVASETAIIARLGHASANFAREQYVDMAEVRARHALGEAIPDLFPDAEAEEID
jgi:integrase